MGALTVGIRIEYGKICNICGLVYETLEYARLCENYCSEHAVGYLVKLNDGTQKIKYFKK